MVCSGPDRHLRGYCGSQSTIVQVISKTVSERVRETNGMDLGLKGKTALVAASSRGLGYAAARQLVLEGARVVICGRSRPRLDEAVAALAGHAPEPQNVAGWEVDLATGDGAARLVDQAVAHFGGLDIVITNAGGPPGGTFGSTELADYSRAFELTLMSAVRLIDAALPHLRRSDAASILTVTSVSLKQPIAGLMLSNVFRPAVAGLTKTLAFELGPEGIRVNSILPGWTATERVGEIMTYRSEKNQTDVAVEEARITGSIPLGRMATPDEFGRVAAFLVSPAASYMTGNMVLVDGGSYAGLL